MSDQISNEILQDNVLLVGKSPENPNNWVILDVQKTAEGRFRILEQRPAENTLVSGDFLVAGWGDFASGGDALTGLSGYLKTHPHYSEYRFSLGEIGGESYSDEYISDGGETIIRARRGGVEGDSSIGHDKRAGTVAAENNRPENLGENTIDDAPNQNNLIRAGRSEPESPGNGESIGDRIQNEVNDFFDNGLRESPTLKGQLENYVLDGGNPILGALGATGLDALDLAMSFTKNNALGILDIRNLGEGVQKGTWEGVREDLGRAVNILPAGKVGKVASAVLTGADLKEAGEQIVEAASQGDSKTAITTVTSIGLGFLISKIKRKKQQSWRDSERDTGDFLEVHFKKGEWSSQTKFKDGSLLKGSKRNPKDSTVPDFQNEDMKVAVESKRYSDVFKRKDKQRLLEQAGGRLINLPNGTKQWLFIDHRGMNLSEKSTMIIYKDYYRSFGGNSVFEKFFIVTEKGIFMF